MLVKSFLEQTLLAQLSVVYTANSFTEFHYKNAVPLIIMCSKNFVINDKECVLKLPLNQLILGQFLSGTKILSTVPLYNTRKENRKLQLFSTFSLLVNKKQIRLDPQKFQHLKSNLLLRTVFYLTMSH